ncbi:MAG: EAL domain-containing protein [Gammaproteobacteria bacterium]|jgi:diguanylate cyclase (GGDEF)-like protein/PAS domain S-box-containing protein
MPKMQENKMPVRALIVEDVEDDALLLVRHLQTDGLKVDWQRVDTEKELMAAMEQPWDIVFSDYSMPRFSGSRALEIIRRHDSDIPFVFVSGTIGEEAAVEAMRAGAQDFVMKGQWSHLLPTLNRELREVRLRRERRQEQQTLRQLSLVVKQAADSVFITDPVGRIEYVNPAFEKLTGYSAEEIKGSTPAILHSGQHDNLFYQKMWGIITRGEVFRGTMINRRKNGELFHEEKVITPLTDEQGRITHFVSTSRDITARVQAEEERSRLAAILEATPDLVAIFEPAGCFRYLNGAGRRLLGLQSQDNIENYYLKDIFPEPMAQQLAVEVLPEVQRTGSWTGETVLRLDQGKEMPVSQVVLAHKDTSGHIEYFSLTARDISERKRFEAQLNHQATHDGLTDLPNRFFLIDRFKSALAHARRHGKYVAVLFLDLNNFKRVNDSLGHAAGDALLQQVARRLKTCLRPNDTVARHGGDEFTIVVGDLTNVEHTLTVLRKLREVFERPVTIGTHELFVTFSTGIALYPHDGDQVDDLLRHADTAMYRAKSSGSSQYRFYAPDMNARGHELLAMEADLRYALDHHEFLLHYQPQVELRSGRIAGLEGLIRWQHPKRGLMSPDDFVYLLENSGLITSVGEWVLRQACIMHRHWREAGFQTKHISVNVSAVQFNDVELLDKVCRAMKEENMPPHMLELEITENIVMRDPENTTEVLQALHDLGVRIAIDDFGTGYSSLAYLKRFPLNVLKIDKTFVGDLGKDSGNAIVEASISLAQKLGFEIVAEGVETAEQLEFLRHHGCDLVQGFHLDRPLPQSEVTQSLDKVWHW